MIINEFYGIIAVEENSATYGEKNMFWLYSININFLQEIVNFCYNHIIAFYTFEELIDY